MSRPRIAGLAPKEARVLLALRAGPCDSVQLNERFTAGPHFAAALVRQGMAEAEPVDAKLTVYRITPAGRQACPRRRDLEALRPAPSFEGAHP